MTMRYDLVLRNGVLIDGTGDPRRGADVAIKGDRIAAVAAPGELRGDNEFDASGLIVAPGFIDVHTHDDTALIENPDMAMKVSQGVTTVICGNCGASPAPMTRDTPLGPLSLIVRNREYLASSFKDFATIVRDARPAVNSAFLIGHSTLRMSAMGEDLYREATPSEVTVMRDLLDASLDEGAIGMSTGLVYAPAYAATTDEVVNVAAALAKWGGVYTTHMRDEGDDILNALDEAFEVGRRANVPLIISHHKCTGRNNFGRMSETLPKIDAARATQDISFDVYPYDAGSTILTKGAVAKAERVIVTWSESVPDAGGRDLADLAQQWNVSLDDAVDRLHPAGAIYFSMHERDVQSALSHPVAMVGSDGLPFDTFPHPRLWGAFTRVLGHYSRDLKLFPLEDAVRRMTSLPAAKFGLTGRGVVRAGAYADICVFDADTVIDAASFQDPVAPSKGIALVLVNGSVAWGDGMNTCGRNGQVLLRQELQSEAR